MPTLLLPSGTVMIGDETALPCGHPASLLVRSVESPHTFCGLCETRGRLADALCMERRLGEEKRATERERDEALTKLGQIEADYQRIVCEVLACDPKPASERPNNDQLEPPWEVIARVRSERDEARAEATRLAGALRRYTDVSDVCVRFGDGLRTCDNTGSDPCRPCQAREALDAAPQARELGEAVRAALMGLRVLLAHYDNPGDSDLTDADVSDARATLAHPALKGFSAP